MNNEITNVSKLVSTPTIKNQRQKEAPPSVATLEKQGTVSSSNQTSDSSKNEQTQDTNKKSSNLETLKSAATAGNSLLQVVNQILEFKVDDSTKKIVIKIVDKQSGETVRQIPSEEMLDFIKKMQELDGEKGSIIENKA